MFEKLNFNMNMVYPTLVVSTVSSGKSTLINALVGMDLLPSMNRACTARAVAILDNDTKPQFEIHAVDNKGNYSFIEKANQTVVNDFNKSNDIAEMIIEGEIKGIRNNKKSMLLIDTPGINNSMDSTHEIVTKKVLDKYPEGLILYVINAQQIGTNDDNCFMNLVAQKLKNNTKYHIMFVVNKMDLIDPAKEHPEELVKNCREYIESKGIEKPMLVLVSASSALLFKKVLYGIELSEFEKEYFLCSYKYFKRDGYSLQDYISVPEYGDLTEIVTVDGTPYTRAQVYAALENTGLPFLVKQMNETLVTSLKMRAPQITVQRSGTSLIKNKETNKSIKKKYKKSKKNRRR